MKNLLLFVNFGADWIQNRTSLYQILQFSGIKNYLTYSKINKSKMGILN